jgi:hypothetical protein
MPEPIEGVFIVSVSADTDKAFKSPEMTALPATAN